MIMFYFSGTGNSKYIAELFSTEMGVECHSIEEDIDFKKLINSEEIIAFCYPVYMSRVPRIMREFVSRHIEPLKRKKLIIFCTQMILSGDGARAFADLFPSGYTEVIYAEHFFMPNNASNMLIVPMASDGCIEKYIAKAKIKMQSVCRDIRAGKIKKRGFNIIGRSLGLVQSPLMSPLEKKANKFVKIISDCNKCRKCVSVCPMKNLAYENEVITDKHNCTMCYRCINKCPKKSNNTCF